jgi:WXG100 family type VII secretion target
MAAPKVRIDYEAMKQIAQAFARESEAAGRTLQSVQRAKEALQRGDWIGQGAKAFYREMDQDVLPSMRRLTQALGNASRVTMQIVQVLQGAENEAASILRKFLTGLLGAAGGILSGVGEAVMGALGHVGDFFVGMWEEGKDMVMGLYNLVTDPIGTAKGLWHGITHPGELWEAFKQPYVEAWESGHPGQAIGRGVMFVGSILLGTKGADKLSKFAKASRAARVSADAAEVGSRLGSASAAAREIGTVARGSRAETALARYIAQESTRTYGAVDRVVLGPFKPNTARGFLGYVEEGRALGATVYNTTDEVWGKINRLTGNDRAWAVNREFMQSQLERGVGGFELRGETVSEVFSRPLSAGTDRALEIRHLQRYAYEYGYRQVGDSWIKVGDWRASTTGRAIGASAGPFLDVLEDVSQ